MSTASPSPRLVLGLSGVQTTEAAQIKALLTFARTRSRAEWLLESDASPDVLLFGGGAAALPGTIPHRCIQVHLVEPGQPALTALRLPRPVQFEPFVQLLLRLEASLIDLPDRAAGAVAARASVATAPDVDRSHVFRLKRWPPVSVLSADRYHPRLASFLSARAMGLEELSRISGASLEHCQTFLALVSQLGIVDIRDRAPDTPAAAAPAPHPGASAATAHHGTAHPKGEAHSSHGLIAMIRHHLGI